MSESAPAPIYVPVIEIVDAGREISWGSNVSEMLTARLDDIRDAIRAGAASVSTALTELPVVGDWHVTEVEASFGITLATEAGVILRRRPLRRRSMSRSPSLEDRHRRLMA